MDVITWIFNVLLPICLTFELKVTKFQTKSFKRKRQLQPLPVDSHKQELHNLKGATQENHDNF